METIKVTNPEFSTLQTKFEAYTGNEPFLFVSYSHRNTEQVYPILDELYDKKYRIWYDESCETGNDFRLIAHRDNGQWFLNNGEMVSNEYISALMNQLK